MNDKPAGYRIGTLELNLDRRDLASPEGPIPLEPRAFSVLVYLIANRARTVSQDELIEQVWPGRVVGNDALYRAIKLVRSALREGGMQDAIKTVHRVGYGFVADVEELGVTKGNPGFVTLLAVSAASNPVSGGTGAGEVPWTGDDLGWIEDHRAEGSCQRRVIEGAEHVRLDRFEVETVGFGVVACAT